jgi:hypothetical protein
MTMTTMVMSESQESDFWDRYAALIQKAWEDVGFKTRLLEDTTAVFAENDIKMPKGLTIKLLEDTESIRHLPFPFKPKAAHAGAVVAVGNVAADDAGTGTQGAYFCCHTWSNAETQQG